jgi:AsmA protein
MRALKYTLIAIVALVVLIAGGAFVFLSTLDLNQYKPQIEQAVKDRTGRTLKLQGDIKAALFPSLGADVAKVSLTERGSEQEFISLDLAHASVAVLPLLHGEVVVDKIKLKGLKANVVKGKDGKFNFDDLLQASAEKPGSQSGPADPKAPKDEGKVKFEVAGVDIEDSSASYRDLATGKALALSGLHLSTGRLGERADGKLQFAASLKGTHPALDLKAELRGDYRVDLGAKTYALSKVDGSVKGTLDQDAVEATLSAPSIDITADKASGDAVNAAFKLKGARSIEASLKLGGVKGSAKALEIPAINAEIAVSGADMPKPFRVPLAGSVHADLEKQTLNADLSSKFDESTVQAKLGLAKFSPPAYLFDVQIDKLNLDQYFPPKPKPAAAPAGQEKGGSSAGAAKQEDTPIDLSALKELNASGKLQVGALQAKGLKLANLKAEVKAANGRLDVNPYSANLYDGAMTGAIALLATGNRVSVKESLTNVQVGPLLRDVAQQDRLEGRGNVSLDVAGAGATVNALKRSLDGSARVNLKDGAIKGINVAEILRKVKSLGGKSEEGAADSSQKTDFTELNASFAIKNGVAHNQDLDVKSPLIRVGGAGNIDIGSSTIDYTVKTSVVASSKGQGGAGLEQLTGLTVPVKLSGPLDSMKYQVDYGAAASQLAKTKAGDKAKEALEKNKGKVEEQVRDRLKGLLGR